MTIETGWLHALLLAHLVRDGWGFDDERAAVWSLQRVRRQELARSTVLRLGQVRQTSAFSRWDASIANLLRSIHQDAWRS